MEDPLRADLTALAGLEIIETFGAEDGTPRRLDAHLARLRATAARLGFAYVDLAARDLIATLPAGPLRCRLTLSARGFALSHAPLAPNPPQWRVAIHDRRLASADPWLAVKTTRRALYDSARAALPRGLDEWLFLNERGELCEGTITNLFLDRDGVLLTPPLACGLLPGILRAELLAQGRAQEAVLTPDDLATGRLFLGNSLRGLIPVTCVPAA